MYFLLLSTKQVFLKSLTSSFNYYIFLIFLTKFSSFSLFFPLFFRCNSSLKLFFSPKCPSAYHPSSHQPSSHHPTLQITDIPSLTIILMKANNSSLKSPIKRLNLHQNLAWFLLLFLNSSRKYHERGWHISSVLKRWCRIN